MTEIQAAGPKGSQERILATAAGLFARYGYNGTSTREIASQAEVNEVTIYRYFRRKRDLYCAALEAELTKVQLRGDLLARLAEAKDGHTALERTSELIAATLGYRPNLLRLVQFSTLELSEDVDQLLRKHLRELVEVVADYLQPWMLQGEAHCANAKALVLALALVVFSRHSFRRVFFDDVASPSEMLSAYEDVWLAGNRS
jgi:AcrR family transcriptional regulator